MRQASELDLGYLLVLAGRAVQSATDVVRFDEGLGAADVNALYELHAHGPLVAGAFAHLLNVRQSTVTAIADRLEGRGLLLRTRDTADRRMIWLSVTERGSDLVRRSSLTVLPLVEDGALAALTPGAKLALRALLAELVSSWLTQRIGPSLTGTEGAEGTDSAMGTGGTVGPAIPRQQEHVPVPAARRGTRIRQRAPSPRPERAEAWTAMVLADAADPQVEAPDVVHTAKLA